jgi:hypothetical protein
MKTAGARWPPTLLVPVQELVHIPDVRPPVRPAYSLAQELARTIR